MNISTDFSSIILCWRTGHRLSCSSLSTAVHCKLLVYGMREKCHFVLLVHASNCLISSYGTISLLNNSMYVLHQDFKLSVTHHTLPLWIYILVPIHSSLFYTAVHFRIQDSFMFLGLQHQF